MKKYIPELLAAISRYQNYIPTLPPEIKQDLYARMGELIEEEKAYGNLPYTDFIRTETLCQGGDVCDFRFVRHETDAGDGWERSESI